MNRVKQALQTGQAVIGPIIQSIRDPAIVRLMAAIGFDFVYLDMEHGPFTIAEISELCQIARDVGIVPIVRPANQSADHLSRPLDVGALGLLVPHVETADQAIIIIENSKYYPLGRRGYSSRGPHTGFRKVPASDFMVAANEDTLIGVLIESAQGIKNVEEIASIPNLDLIVLGRGDLSQDLGIPGQLDADPVQQAVNIVLQACQHYGKAMGMICFDKESAQHWLEVGVRMLNYGSEVSLLTDLITENLIDIRSYCANHKIPFLKTV
jgi:2-keto-3-deoxy-L-rhamnonate aldolase RhmA